MHRGKPSENSIAHTKSGKVALTCRLETKAAPYAEALRAVGIEPELLRPGNAPAPFAGLVLTGGSDVNPALYGQPRSPLCREPDDERDAFERGLLEVALARGAPVLAICRGMQLFNVAHAGGTLKQHIDGHEVRGGDPAESVHDIEPAPESRLAAILGPGPLPVNSRHHQAIDAVGRGLIVAARSFPDGVIEALERPDLRFAVAVQWHPEDQVRLFPIQLKLFEAFARSLQKP